MTADGYNPRKTPLDTRDFNLDNADTVLIDLRSKIPRIIRAYTPKESPPAMSSLPEGQILYARKDLEARFELR